MAAKIGVDTGGTFTDCIFMDDAGVTVYKILTTPDNPARAVLQGLRHVCPDLTAINIIHGSTVQTLP